jgi:hypothetical protein
MRLSLRLTGVVAAATAAVALLVVVSVRNNVACVCVSIFGSRSL